MWVDLCSPTEAELAAVSEELGLHRVAVEDAVHEHQLPKLDRYGTHAFLIASAVRMDPATGGLDTCEVAAFVTDRALVTVRTDENVDIDAVVDRWDGTAELAHSGVGFLVHGLLDYVADSHLDAVQALDEQIEALEEGVFAARVDHADVQRRSRQLRTSLVTLRRVVLAMREVASALMHRDLHLVDDALLPYYQHVDDHLLRASEWIDSLRELLTTIWATRLNLQGNRLNRIMKRVFSWAAIIAVPPAVTGFYGQHIPYPGFDPSWGFWVSTAAILVFSAALYVMFSRRGWL